MNITIDNIPGYDTRSFPELDDFVLKIANDAWADAQIAAEANAAATIEYDEKNKGNSLAYLLRPMQTSAETLWAFNISRIVPMIVELHRAKLGVQMLNEDGSMNPAYRP